MNLLKAAPAGLWKSLNLCKRFSYPRNGLIIVPRIFLWRYSIMSDTSYILFKNAYYTACAMRDGSDNCYE